MSKIIITDDALRLAAASVREAMLSTIPAPEECRHTFSLEFEAKMEQLMKTEQRRSHRRSIARRVAAVFLAALIGVSAWLAIDTQARASFFNWVREVYETHIVYRFTGEVPTETLPEYRLGWLPEGYVQVSSSGTEEMWAALYQSGEDALTFVYYRMAPGEVGSIYDTGSDGEPLTVNGNSGHFYPGADEASSNGLAWIDEKQSIFFMLSGFLSSDDMLHIAETLYLEEMPK